MKGAAVRAWGAARTAAAAVVRARPALAGAASRAVARYESFTGAAEVRGLQKSVIAAQDKFIAAQEKRREAGERLMETQKRLKEIHDEMQTISKGDPNYLRLITEEHKIIVDEDALRKDFGHIERVEREYFSAMTAAVKLSQETERIYAEKNKYIYVLASVVGTVLGVLGSSINNRIKMAEFKEMILEEKSGSKIWNLNFSEGKTHKKLADLESRVVAISTNQKTILDYIIKIEKMIETQFGSTKHLINSSISTQNKIDKNNLSTKLTALAENANAPENWRNYSYFVLASLIIGYFCGKSL